MEVRMGVERASLDSFSMPKTIVTRLDIAMVPATVSAGSTPGGVYPLAIPTSQLERLRKDISIV